MPFVLRLLTVVVLLFTLQGASFANQDLDFIEALKADVINEPTLQERCPAILTLLDRLKREGFACEKGADADQRSVFVTTQGLVENLLNKWLQLGYITKALGVIHTPMPATPLCTEGFVNEELIHPSMLRDNRRLYAVVSRAEIMSLCLSEGLIFDTIVSRARIVREFMAQGGLLVIAYPKMGMNRRNAEQQIIYHKEVQKYSETLIDAPLKSLPDEMVGATYVVRLSSGPILIFSIKAPQAKEPKEDLEWGLWLATYDNSNAREHLHAVWDSVSKNGGPKLSKFFELE